MYSNNSFVLQRYSLYSCKTTRTSRETYHQQQKCQSSARSQFFPCSTLRLAFPVASKSNVRMLGRSVCRSSSIDAMRLRWGFLEPSPSLNKCPSVSSCPYEQPSKRQDLLHPSLSSRRPHEILSRSVCQSSSTDAMRLRWGFLEPSPSLKKCPSVSSCPYKPLESAPFSAKKRGFTPQLSLWKKTG